MKNSVFIFITFFLFFGISTLAAGEPLCGDVNDDGAVTIIDALDTARFFVGLTDTINVNAADVNDDGEITIVDCLLIALYYVGYIDELTCPTPEPTIEPTIDPTPEPESIIDGDWRLNAQVNLRVLTSQFIYDHSEEFWTAEVEMTGYINDTITMDVKKTVRYTPPGYSITYTLTTEPAIYPSFTITISFTDHGGFRLLRIQIILEESEETTIEFVKSYGIPYPNPGANILIVDNGSIPSEDGTKEITPVITLSRLKTLAIDPDTLYTLPYKPYDELTYVDIEGDTFSSSFIYQGDIIVSIIGSAAVNDNILTLDYDSNNRFASMVPPPLVFEIITGDTGDIILKRNVPDPGETGIRNYYGIEQGTLDYYEYNQLYIKRQ